MKTDSTLMLVIIVAAALVGYYLYQQSTAASLAQSQAAKRLDDEFQLKLLAAQAANKPKPAEQHDLFSSLSKGVDAGVGFFQQVTKNW